MKTILEAAVYCGTYRKYNKGNLNGKWMKLADYTTKRKFLQACAALHDDEQHPEFMFQDYENIPTSQVSESSISDEVWHTINSLKKYAPEQADEFAEWCEENGAEQDYSALREFLQFKPKNKDKNEMSKDDMRERILLALNGDNRFADDILKRASAIVEIAGKQVLFKKQNIKTRFCFSDEGSDLERYKTFNKKDFISENLYWADGFRYLDHEATCGQKWYLVRRWYGEIYTVVCKDEWKAEEGDIEMTPEQVEQFKDALRTEKTKFEKRLHAYLKRYGLSKIDTWTYWADR